MKCLLCDFKTNNTPEPEDHYLNFHNVDRENRFFKTLFEDEKNVFHGGRCVRCNEFLSTTKFKTFHDFLKHYEAGKNVIEEKPLTVTSIGNIKKYEINYQNHSSDYDFYNSESLVDEFLLNVKNRIEKSDVDFFICCGFSLENMQPSLEDYDQPLKSLRYWSTDPIQTKSFNDFVFFNIRESVLKRVINNGLTGSSWHFHRFLYINIKTIKVTDQLIR